MILQPKHRFRLRDSDKKLAPQVTMVKKLMSYKGHVVPLLAVDERATHLPKIARSKPTNLIV